MRRQRRGFPNQYCNTALNIHTASVHFNDYSLVDTAAGCEDHSLIDTDPVHLNNCLSNFFSLESKKKKKQNLRVQSSAELLASSTMVLSPLCPTYLNVRPSGNPPTQDHMLPPAAQKITKLKDTSPHVTYHDSDNSLDTAD